MRLARGSRLGPYEVLSLIGAGGMGEVYKACDTRLDRTVALKVCAERFSERFEREARAVGALNHPNICTLHDVGPNYLVMEHIDGQPLKGPLPLDQALRYACQICDALDAAHRQGVIHRDLKPANILVTKSGIKLLDFGLAKRSREAAASDATATMDLTRENTILGTLQYMSPEQLEGKEADARSDLFSFGLVLYEILTGKHPFDGLSTASVIAAILEREPPSVAHAAPPSVDRVLRRCLAKQPDDRWQSARDLRTALQWATELEGVTAPGASRTNRWRGRAGWIAAAVVASVSLALAPWRQPPAGEPVRFPIYPPVGASFSRTSNATVPVPQFALAPNGRALAFCATAGAKSTLWARFLDQTAARQLPGTEGALRPFWSPDSQWIGFFAEGKMKKVLAAGGPVQTVAEDILDQRGGAWGSDDAILYSDGSEGVLRVPAGGGHSQGVTAPDAGRAERAHRWPQLLPDKRHFLITIRSTPEYRGIYAMTPDGATKKRLVVVDSSGMYAAPGYLLWVEGGTLLGQSFDAGKLDLTGQLFPVAEGVGRSSASEAAVSASASGALAYSGALLQEGRLTWFDRSGGQLDSPVPAGDYADFRLSPDGNRLAASMADLKTGGTTIWITDLVRHSRPERFTFAPGVNGSVAWSPDGSRISFRTNRAGLLELYQRSASGDSDAMVMRSLEALRADGIATFNLGFFDWSPDGQWIIAGATGRGTGFDLWLMPAGSGGKATKLAGSESASDEIHGNFSPEGKVVAYSSNDAGRHEIYVRTLQSPYQRWLVSTGGGYEPRWRADGRELYYLSESRHLMAVSVGPGPSFGTPKALFQTKAAGGVDPFRAHYVPTRDGQRFLINVQTDPAPQAITVVLNWTAGLKK